MVSTLDSKPNNGGSTPPLLGTSMPEMGEGVMNVRVVSYSLESNGL